MNKNTVIGLLSFVLTEILCVMSLFSSDWVISKHIGTLQLGLTVYCHGPPGEKTLCTFRLPHTLWLSSAIFMGLAVCVFALCVCFLVIALHRKSKSFERAAKWMGLSGIMLLCLVGITFPIGFSSLELGRQHFLLPHTFSVGYAYVLFNFSIFVSILSLLITNKFFTCSYFRLGRWFSL